MSTHRRAAALVCCVVLASPLGFTALAAADADDLPSSARELAPGVNTGAIEVEGDQDWYVLPGGRLAPAGVSLVTLGIGCGEERLLNVELFNPEGRWMRTQILSSSAGLEIPVPRFPGRYTLRIIAASPSCTELGYTIRFVDCAAATTAKCAFAPDTPECRKAKSDQRLAKQIGISGDSRQARRHRRLFDAATTFIRKNCR